MSSSAKERISSATLCSVCKTALGDSANSCMLVFEDRRMILHSACLQCSSCAKSIPSGFVLISGAIFCNACSTTMYHPICYDCGSPIRCTEEADAIEAMGNLYHGKCFVCAFTNPETNLPCNEQLRGQFYVNKNDRVFCQEHPPEGIQPELQLQH